MGIFTGIGLVTPDATRYKQKIRSLERTRARMMVEGAQNKLAFQEQEDPREQSMLMHSMWGRGLGKSSIYDQAKDRLNLIQSQRMQMLKENLTYAQIYQRMIKKKHHWEKVNQYYEMIDGIIGLAAGATHSSSTSYDTGFDAGMGSSDIGTSFAVSGGGASAANNYQGMY